MRRTLVAVAVVAILVAGAAVVVLESGASPDAAAVKRAYGYLDADYNPSIGLVSATPHGTTYFVYSDNFLVSLVFERSGNSSLEAIGTTISATDAKYLAKVSNPENQYEVIDSSNGAFFASKNYVLAHVGSATVESTFNNGSGALSPTQYADIAFLDSLYARQVGGATYAKNDFQAGASFWDGTGLNDSAWNGTYQTYKLALYDYVGKTLGYSLPSGLDSDLLKLQSPSGGFYTGYGPGFAPVGVGDANSTNAETTALAILALTTPAK